VTEEDEEIRSSILLLDEDGQHLKQGAASRLPDFYCQAVNGLLIGEGVGSCGTAAFLGERVIVADIQQHPYWKKFLPLAEQAGIQACWSEPIISSENKVLGTFTLYYSTVKTPSNATIKKIEELAYLASLAIEKSNTEERIRHLAFYDTLTQLPNRRLLNERLTQEIVRLERQSGYGALMFLDLDHFKTLNDSLGHHIGDELLIQVAARLKDCVREQDTVARLGGDEFVVLQTAMSNNSLEQASDCALTIAKRIQAALYIPYSLQGYEHHVTSSIGITLFSRDNKEIDALFKQADTAMYAAKTKGRNTFSFYNSQMQHHADQQLELERDLLIALNNQQFELRYQAQYDFQGLIVSAEALLCWVHPEKGLIDPAEFMPACEKSGLILAIGEWALKTVCQQLLLWPMLQHIAINIPPRQFQQSGFIQQVTDILKEYQLPTSSLMLELTEQAIIKDNAASIEKLTALQSLGVCVAIDNFGVGYSSVAYLKKLPINQIKLDSRFIRDIGDANNNTVIVETMIMIAKQLRLLVAAEGVETEQQLDYLHTMGCNIYQGCYFSEPLPTTEFGAFLAQNLN
jgi:diguanylate cyclase (GGDEF)-like protein